MQSVQSGDIVLLYSMQSDSWSGLKYTQAQFRYIIIGGTYKSWSTVHTLSV